MAYQVEGARSVWPSLAVLACVALLGAGPGLAQTPQPHAPPPAQPGMDEAATDMGGHARLKDASHRKRMETVEFIAGNMLFVVLHETAHTLVTEMGLPVLGREEDAADAYASVTMLKLGSRLSYHVLIEAAKGWFLSAERNERQGNMLAFYDEHGLDWQRAYQIVCLMVGSDPDQFKPLADWVQMPESRQETCQGDYSNASWSWDTALKPHRRTGDQPKAKMDVVYGEGKGKLDVYARAFRTIGFLEAIADYNADNFVWRAPFTLEMQSCGEPDAHWDLQARKLLVCYEMAEEFVQLYQDIPAENTSPGKMAPSEMLARNIRRLRLQRGMSTEKMAAEAGLDHAWCARMERGQETATASQLEKLARAFRMQSSDLIALPRSTETAAKSPAPGRLKQ
ncbi:MAG TPA: DUF4344 domain-containing metallopeptidase [Xanthobacteraceae bacterium]|nr:DUF4344 domain-containing metallopeptidase [Xanthobacteraceae bacterium]